MPQTATRSCYNKDEEIAWSIKVATGWGGFVDALVDSEEYQANFGDTIALSAPSLQRPTD